LISTGVKTDPQFVGSQPTGDNHKPSGRLPLFSARPAVTFTSVKSITTQKMLKMNKDREKTGQRRTAHKNNNSKRPLVYFQSIVTAAKTLASAV